MMEKTVENDPKVTNVSKENAGDAEHLLSVIFVNAKVNDVIIFNGKEPRVMVTDILQPIVKIENCEWLKDE